MPDRRIPQYFAACLAILAPACIEPPPPIPPDGQANSGDPAKSTALLWEGRSPGDLYAAGEIRRFSLSQGDTLIGHTWGRYVGPEGEGSDVRHRFETRTELLLPGRPPTRAEGMLLLDDDGHLLEGYERSDAVEVSFERKDNLLHLTDGTQRDELLYEPERNDTAFMAHSAIFHEELMLGLRRLEDGALEWRVVSLSGGAPVEWEATVVRAPKQTGGLAKIRTNLGETITVENGRLLRSEVRESGLIVESMPGVAKWPKWTIEGPPTLTYEQSGGGTFEVRPVELPGRPGEPALFGEVLIPPKAKTPIPAVLWVSGTGREDRHGFAGPPPVDLGSHEITDALAEAGVVVLRFDDRGQGQSEAGPMSFTAQLEDLRRAYRTLVVQPEVDPDRIVVVAHGEGGLRALSLAVQQGAGVSALALLASPGRPYLDVLRDQGTAALADVPPELRDKAAKQQRKMLEGLEAGEFPPELRDHEQWLREVLRLDPAKMIKRIDAPIWLAQGGKDFEVDPSVDPRALMAATQARGKVKAATIERYPELDHLFKPEPGRSTPARYREPGRAVDPKFLADLTAWVVEVTKPAKKSQRGGKKKR